MAHMALYRTWRPQTFADVVGQQHITKTLQNALEEGRVSHAYLFSGPRGTGKTTAAKLFAKAVNCERGPAAEPCNECSACLRITEGNVMDVLEIDAASNRGVEEIRDIRDKVKYAPTEVRRKVYIIDEVHMLTTEAFNALLKTLEEPPAHVMFILATTESHRLPATILSRCQRFDFKRISLEEQLRRLNYVVEQENLAIEPEALQYIARLSDGGMRDALSVLDQVISFTDGRVTYADVVAMTGGVAADQFEQLAVAIQQQDSGQALQFIDQLMQEGKSPDKCMESLIHYFRDLLMIRMIPDAGSLTDRVLDAERFRQLAERFASEELFRAIDALNHYQVEMKYSAQPRTMLEIAVLKVCAAGTASLPGAVPAAVAAVGPSIGGSTASAELRQELTRMREQLAGLERQVEELRRSPAPSTDAGGANDPADRSRPRASLGAGTAKPGTGGLGLRADRVKLDGFIQQQQSAAFKQVLGKWSQVLARVKELRITVHAWLVDGEPVSQQDDQLLLAFKSAMHRETTEKPANKQLIEQALREVLGQPTTLVTVMQRDWREAQSAVQEPELLQLEPESPEESAAPQEEWVSEAIKLFGEELVHIKE